MSDEMRNEIIKAFAQGYDVEVIARVEDVEIKTVKAIIEEAKALGKLDEYKERGV